MATQYAQHLVSIGITHAMTYVLKCEIFRLDISALQDTMPCLCISIPRILQHAFLNGLLYLYWFHCTMQHTVLLYWISSPYFGLFQLCYLTTLEKLLIFFLIHRLLHQFYNSGQDSFYFAVAMAMKKAMSPRISQSCCSLADSRSSG